MAQELRLPIFPCHAYTAAHDERIFASSEDDPFPFPHSKYWGPRAKWLLAEILAQSGLGRHAEVAILTTTDWAYVSTCLSVTAFNYCRISRVVTDATRAVIVVHEFGYPYREIGAKAEEWKKNGILIIEDCAHVIGLELEGCVVGSFGDFSLFSLAKLFPTPCGGLLLTNKPFRLPVMSEDERALTSKGIKAAEQYLPHHKWFSANRQVRHDLVKSNAKGGVWEPSSPAIPFATYVRKQKLNPVMPGVEFLSTLSEDYLLLPTNPLVDEGVFIEIAQSL